MLKRSEIRRPKLLLSALVRGAALRTYVGRRKLATGAAAALTLVVGYHVVFGHNGLTKYQQKRTVAKQLEVKLRDLQQENDRLKAHVDRLGSDPNAIEHQAREELHYTRPGEVIYTLPNQSAQGDGTTQKK